MCLGVRLQLPPNQTGNILCTVYPLTTEVLRIQHGAGEEFGATDGHTDSMYTRGHRDR